MSYHPTECIFDLLVSCGPQDRAAAMAECKAQCTGFPLRHMEDRRTRIGLLDGALKALEQAGIIVMDEIGAYDLTDFGYQLADEWNGWVHTRGPVHLALSRENYSADFRPQAQARLTACLA